MAKSKANPARGNPARIRGVDEALPPMAGVVDRAFVVAPVPFASAGGPGLEVDARPATAKWIQGLTPEMPLHEALELIFQHRWQGLLHCFRKVTSGPGQAEADVHQLRVASRRVTMVLDMLRGDLRESLLAPLRKLVNKMRRACGATRDLDVQILFLQTVTEHASPGEQAAIAFMLRQLARRRLKAQAKMLIALQGLESRAIAASSEVAEALQQAERSGCTPLTEQNQNGFASRGVQTLSAELAAVWRCAEQDLADPDQRHQLRIECKHLRYGVETFMPILHESFRDEFYPQLQHIQDLLGEMQDAQTACVAYAHDRRRWHACCKQAKGDGPRIKWSKLRGGISAILAAYRERAEHAQVEFRELWPLFAGDSFRIPVEEMLASIAEQPASASYSTSSAALVAEKHHSERRGNES